MWDNAIGHIFGPFKKKVNRRQMPSDAKSLCEPLTMVRLKGRHIFLALHFCDQNKIYIIIFEPKNKHYLKFKQCKNNLQYHVYCCLLIFKLIIKHENVSCMNSRLVSILYITYIFTI